jgi:hypothetical protein
VIRRKSLSERAGVYTWSSHSRVTGVPESQNMDELALRTKANTTLFKIHNAFKDDKRVHCNEEGVQ